MFLLKGQFQNHSISMLLNDYLLPVRGRGIFYTVCQFAWYKYIAWCTFLSYQGSATKSMLLNVELERDGTITPQLAFSVATDYNPHPPSSPSPLYILCNMTCYLLLGLFLLPNYFPSHYTSRDFCLFTDALKEQCLAQSRSPIYSH
jgi:hypothetical protein